MKKLVQISSEPAANTGGREAGFSVTVDETQFKVCHYFDAPGECHVVSPPDAGHLPAAKQLVDYLISVLGFQTVFFGDKAHASLDDAIPQALLQEPLIQSHLAERN